MPTHYEYALLANAVYENDGGKEKNIIPGGWEIHDCRYPQSGKGIGCAAYIHHKKKEIVIAIRGTTNRDDIFNDLRLFFNGKPNNTLGLHVFSAKTRKNHSEEIEKKRLQTPLAQALMTDYENQYDIIKLIRDYTFEYPREYIKKNIPQESDKTREGNNKEEIIGIHIPPSGRYESRFATPFMMAKQLEENKKNAELIQRLEKEKSERNTKEASTAKKQIHPKDMNLQYSNLEEAIKKIEQEFPYYSFSLTGHSLGATMAELCSSTLSLPAITFDSPGCKTIAENQLSYKKEAEQHIICYLSAPNIVNTCHEHIGSCFRLYIPHNPSKRASFGYATNCLLSTTARVATFGLGLWALSKSTGALDTDVNLLDDKTDKFIAGGGLIASAFWSHSKGVFTTLLLATPTQHKMENIIHCFDAKTGEAKPYVNAQEYGIVGAIKSWPTLNPRTVLSHVKKCTSFFLPFQRSNPGLHTLLFSTENDVKEEQVKTLPGYEVEPQSTSTIPNQRMRS